MTDKIVVFSTCTDEKEGEKLARLLVESRLAACVSMIPGMRSYYRWKGHIEASGECLLLIKSSREHFEQVRAMLEAAHSYEIPELIALPIIQGSARYLSWLDENTAGPLKGE